MFYRIYVINNYNEIDGPPFEAECSNDASAIRLASKLVEGSSAEIWERTRLVARVKRRGRAKARMTPLRHRAVQA